MAKSENGNFVTTFIMIIYMKSSNKFASDLRILFLFPIVGLHIQGLSIPWSKDNINREFLTWEHSCARVVQR